MRLAAKEKRPPSMKAPPPRAGIVSGMMAHGGRVDAVMS
jgi:hypothetical protein